ncbi:CvpA family protein [Spirosoma sp. KUDC1026]|uniref:CvpA family protein n=1 Tax=Spirosoma sp. KUDC1026 TaxID=2745947 RepID=UPI00159BE6C7|nr:CvpA family protein [Spirosoma sp. KUDC1026]QKZ14322.1 CvpA family protein [Spirosoma sp. KUDC1026]
MMTGFQRVYDYLVELVELTDWVTTYFQPALNAGNWLAAAAGAFVIRFARPQLPLRSSLAGWLVGFLLACLFAPDVVAAGGIGLLKRSESVYAAIAFVGDFIIQLIAWLIRLSSKVGDTIEADPAGSFDSSLERVEKVTSLWVRIKTPIMELINTVLGR